MAKYSLEYFIALRDSIDIDDWDARLPSLPYRWTWERVNKLIKQSLPAKLDKQAKVRKSSAPLKQDQHVISIATGSHESPVSIAERDRPFNGFRIAKSEQARALVADVLNQIQTYEANERLRKRARKPTDQLLFQRQVEALVCDLAHRHISHPDKGIAVPFSKRILGIKDRYRACVLSKTLPCVVQRMASDQLTFAELELGMRKSASEGGNRQTVVRAGLRLQERIVKLQLTLKDFGLKQVDETIILKASKEDRFDKGARLNYDDDFRTLKFRSEMVQINTWLADADLDFLPLERMESAVDVSNRRLRRVFNNGSFEEGGRLFGGFWQSLSKVERRKGIRINGIPTVTVDYGQMCPRIVYGLAGIDPHFTDAYAVPGLEMFRDGVKTVFNAMLHAKKELSRAPNGSRPLLPRGWHIDDVTAKIMSFHAPIDNAFYAGRGMHIFFQESSILIALLLRLKEQGITALPIHDAVVVSEDDQEETERIMLDVFKQHTDIDGQVSIDY